MSIISSPLDGLIHPISDMTLTLPYDSNDHTPTTATTATITTSNTTTPTTVNSPSTRPPSYQKLIHDPYLLALPGFILDNLHALSVLDLSPFQKEIVSHVMAHYTEKEPELEIGQGEGEGEGKAQGKGKGQPEGRQLQGDRNDQSQLLMLEQELEQMLLDQKRKQEHKQPPCNGHHIVGVGNQGCGKTTAAILAALICLFYKPNDGPNVQDQDDESGHQGFSASRNGCNSDKAETKRTRHYQAQYGLNEYQDDDDDDDDDFMNETGKVRGKPTANRNFYSQTTDEVVDERALKVMWVTSSDEAASRVLQRLRMVSTQFTYLCADDAVSRSVPWCNQSLLIGTTQSLLETIHSSELSLLHLKLIILDDFHLLVKDKEILTQIILDLSNYCQIMILSQSMGNSSIAKHHVDKFLQHLVPNAYKFGLFPPETASQMTTQQVLDLKQQANILFTNGRYVAATHMYTCALSASEIDSDLKATLYANRAAAKLKQVDFTGAIEDCRKCVELQPDYTKAWMRMKSACETIQDYEGAIDATKELIKRNQVSRAELTRLEMEKKRYDEKAQADAMEKLKEMGNSILGTFGLSLDNFKFEQNESGSYNVKFER